MILYLSGFNGNRNIQEMENNIMRELSESLGTTIKKVDYYESYKSHKLDSKPLITGVVEKINSFYFSNERDNQPLTIVGWSLGGCILAEALNIIKAQNELADMCNEQDARIEIDRVILFSPAWYINNIKGLLSSTFRNQEYENPEIKKINAQSNFWATDYVLSDPRVLYYLFNISENVDTKGYSYETDEKTKEITEKEGNKGLEIFRDFKTTVVLPNNDSCIDIPKTEAKCNELELETLKIGKYGHMSPLDRSVIDLVIQDINSSKRRA